MPRNIFVRKKLPTFRANYNCARKKNKCDDRELIIFVPTFCKYSCRLDDIQPICIDLANLIRGREPVTAEKT